MWLVPHWWTRCLKLLATKFRKINLKMLVSSINWSGQGCFFTSLRWKYIWIFFGSIRRIIQVGLRNFGIIIVYIWVINTAFVSQLLFPQFDILKLLLYLYYREVKLLCVKMLSVYVRWESRNMEVSLLRVMRAFH